MRVIAHRSGPDGVYPEQTILTAQAALKSGAHMIELDVRYTKDKRIAISHDKELGRVFGVSCETDTLTEAEFLSLRHKNAPAFSSHLFEHYMMAEVAPILIHIKEEELIDDLIALIEKYQYGDKVVFGVQSVALAEHLKKKDPRYLVLAFMPRLEDLDAYGASSVDYIRLWEQWCTAENVSRIHSYKKEAWLMTNGEDVGVTSEESLLRMLTLNLDGILINDVHKLLCLLDS